MRSICNPYSRQNHFHSTPKPNCNLKTETYHIQVHWKHIHPCHHNRSPTDCCKLPHHCCILQNRSHLMPLPLLHNRYWNRKSHCHHHNHRSGMLWHMWIRRIGYHRRHSQHNLHLRRLVNHQTIVIARMVGTSKIGIDCHNHLSCRRHHRMIVDD